MVKQLGIPTYFLTLFCADLRWEELTYIIDQLNNLGLSDEEVKSSSYQERCNLLNNSPLHFQYKLKYFSKKSYLMVHWGKENVTLYILKIKKWVYHTFIHSHGFLTHQIIENEAAYIEVFEKTIHAQLSDHLNDPERFDLFRTYQIHAHFRTCWKYNKNECRFLYG